MRSFVIFCALAVGTACSQGYDYSQSNSHQQISFGSQHESFSSEQQHQFTTQPHFNGPALSFGGDQNQVMQHSQQVQFGSSSYANMDHAHSLSMMQGDHHHYQQNAPSPIITKHFYIHSAPEDDDDDLQEQELNAIPARTHYRVLFIKAPAQSSKSAAQQLAQAQKDEKTVIYVLSKKPDLTELQRNLQAIGPPASKPEVFFIKYKTPEEARHAQTEIQAQYDALGGTSDVSDEGVAPVHSFIGALEDSNKIDSGNSAFSSYGVPGYTGSPSVDHETTDNAVYLPPTY